MYFQGICTCNFSYLFAARRCNSVGYLLLDKRFCVICVMEFKKKICAIWLLLLLHWHICQQVFLWAHIFYIILKSAQLKKSKSELWNMHKYVINTICVNFLFSLSSWCILEVIPILTFWFFRSAFGFVVPHII